MSTCSTLQRHRSLAQVMTWVEYYHKLGSVWFKDGKHRDLSRAVDLPRLNSRSAGIKFGATHAERILVAGLPPQVVVPKVKTIRKATAAAYPDPASVKIFTMIALTIGKGEEDVKRNYDGSSLLCCDQR